MNTYIRFSCLSIFICLFLFSCSTVTQIQEPVSIQEDESVQPDSVIEPEKQSQIEEPTEPEKQSPIEEPKRLTLTFGGDIMAHTPNFSIADYSLIYKDIEQIIQNDDLTFANLETPVHSEREYESYPTFNVKPPYVQAAIDAGFDVFSLANNHTNDQGPEGMKKTRDYFKGKTADKIYAAGIKDDGATGLTFQLVEKDGWKILFVAITELLNSHTDVEMIDYIAPNAQRRELLCQELKKLRQDNPCDIFVLSVHTCEDEYVHEITELRRNLYRNFIKSGVDIVWANHPHLAKEWEIFTKEKVEDTVSNPYAIAMYALGNTISGQRTNPQFTKPETNRDYTGDGYLIQVEFEKYYPEEKDDTTAGFKITRITPYLITTYIDTQKQYVIRVLNDEFIQELKDADRMDWANYLSARKKLMEKINGKTVKQ